MLAAGSAEIVLDGETYPVDRPQVIPIEEANADIPKNHQRPSRPLGVADALRLYHAEHD